MPALQSFVSAVTAQLGAPYLWGGTSPAGFDCSGLMEWAAQSVGVSIPRTSEEQYADLPASGPGIGNLVFFNVPGDSQSGANHVGMCADPSCSTMVNAPQPGQSVDLVSVAGTGTVLGYRSIPGLTGSATYNGQTSAAATGAASGGNTAACCVINLPLVGCVFTKGNAKAFLSAILIGVGGVVVIGGLALLAAELLEGSKVGKVAGGMLGGGARVAGKLTPSAHRQRQEGKYNDWLEEQADEAQETKGEQHETVKSLTVPGFGRSTTKEEKDRAEAMRRRAKEMQKTDPITDPF